MVTEPGKMVREMGQKKGQETVQKKEIETFLKIFLKKQKRAETAARVTRTGHWIRALAKQKVATEIATEIAMEIVTEIVTEIAMETGTEIVRAENLTEITGAESRR